MSWFKRGAGKKAREKATALVVQGVGAAREGRLVEASALYQAAIDADDGLAVAHLNLGLARLDLFNQMCAQDQASASTSTGEDALEDIARALQRALDLDATSWVGWRALARVQERRHRFAEAEDAWHSVQRTAPKEGPAILDAQRAHRALAGRAAADRAHSRALQALAADSAAAERLAALAGLLPHLEGKEGLEGEALKRGFALAGSLARRAGEPAQARLLLERAVMADAHDIEAWRELASVALQQGDLKRALAASLEAYRENPSDAGLVCNVGVCWLALGDVDEAAEYIELAGRLDPKDPIVQRAREALTDARAG